MTDEQRVKQTRDPEKTRERILDAAEAIFAERGYAGARVQAIVDRAGVNKRMPYHYFGSKQALYTAVITHRFNELAEAASSAAEPVLEAQGPVAALAALLAAYFDALASRPRYSRLIQWEAAARWSVLNRVVPRVRAELGRLMVRILHEGMEQGAFDRSLDPDFVWWLILGVPSHYFFDRPRMQQFWDEDLTQPGMVGHHREQAIQFVMRGIGAASAGSCSDRGNGDTRHHLRGEQLDRA